MPVSCPTPHRATRRANPQSGAGRCDAVPDVPPMIVQEVDRVRPAGRATDPGGHCGVDLQISSATRAYGKLVGGSAVSFGSYPSKTRRLMALRPAWTPLVTHAADVFGVCV